MPILIRIAKGKETIVAKGSLPKLNDRLKQLRGSTARGVCGRGGTYKVRYEIRKEQDGRNNP